jgi:hypothetical protein
MVHNDDFILLARVGSSSLLGHGGGEAAAHYFDMEISARKFRHGKYDGRHRS